MPVCRSVLFDRLAAGPHGSYAQGEFSRRPTVSSKPVSSGASRFVGFPAAHAYGDGMMDSFEQHVDALVGLKSDRERKRYLEQHAELRCDEGARVLCRSAVALLQSDIDQARGLCRAL